MADEEPKIPQGRLMTVKEVAAVLSVSDQTIRTLAKSGELPTVKHGRLWRFVPDDIREFIRRGRDDRPEEHSD